MLWVSKSENLIDPLQQLLYTKIFVSHCVVNILLCLIIKGVLKCTINDSNQARSCVHLARAHNVKLDYCI